MAEQQLLLPEENYVNPLKKILSAPPTARANPQENTKSIKESLDTLFPEQQYDEKNSKRAKEILGTVVNELTDIQLQSTIAEVQYLAESWLDDFERETFDGLTLKELLHEKGNI